jgi:hypothetical protein
MMFRRFALIVPVVPLLAACLPSPESLETEPVVISSPAGPVTCQLYTPEIVAWDRSINRPDAMSVAEADGICQAEGRRQALRTRPAP